MGARFGGPPVQGDRHALTLLKLGDFALRRIRCGIAALTVKGQVDLVGVQIPDVSNSKSNLKDGTGDGVVDRQTSIVHPNGARERKVGRSGQVVALVGALHHITCDPACVHHPNADSVRAIADLG